MSEFITRREWEEFQDSTGHALLEATNQLHEIADRAGRAPSKAHIIGSGPSRGHSYQTDPQPGEFLLAVLQARSRDAAEQAIGKSTLEALGLPFLSEPDVRALGSKATLSGHWRGDGKATLGLTDATGGWILPNALVDDMARPKGYSNIYRSLLTVRTGVRSATVDIPFRSAAPGRAVIAPWGDTKENSNLAYNGYTATMYTLARIYDLGKQFVRTSQGAAEADVLAALGHAMALGEAYYTISGAGTTEPYGLKTALAAGPSTFRTTFSPVAGTIAGAIATAIGTAAGALIGRNRQPEAAVLSATAYAAMMTQGTDTAGYFLSGISGPESVPGFRPGTLISPWGIPVIPDSQFEADDLIVGEWSALKMYTGDGYRVDTSEEAGTRWDANLIGFRGEEEMGLDARPAVYAGAFQLVEDVIP